MVSQKTCIACGSRLPLEDFYKHPMMADGLLGKCKGCCKAASTKRRWSKINEVREYDLARSKNPKRMEAAKKTTQSWKRADPRRSKAHSAVANAIKSGRLQRSSCERCGFIKTVAHHEDYEKPLDVVWLCQPCHKQRHKEINQLTAIEKVTLTDAA